MKFKLLIIIIIASVFSLFADDLSDGFGEVDSLLVQKKYLTAINKVNELASKYEDPQIIYYRVKVSIEGFATSISHKMFGFKDLEPEEDIYEVRSNGGEFSMVMGDLQEDVKSYLEKYPDSRFVNEAAGDYYNDILLRYGDQLEYSYEDLYSLVVKHYLRAYEQGAVNLKVVSEIGENYLYLGNYEQGARFYEIAASMEHNSPSINYNLGFALIRTGENKKAINYLESAAQVYDDPDLKSDAFGLIGDANLNLEEYPDAISNYKKSVKLNPQNYVFQSNLIKALCLSGSESEADDLCNEIVIANIKSFDALHSIIQAYVQSQRAEMLEEKLTELVNETEGTVDEGTIHFYLAQVKEFNGKSPKNDFIRAREIYSEFLPADHGILPYLDSLIGK